MEYKYRKSFSLPNGKRKNIRSNDKADFERKCAEVRRMLDGGVDVSDDTKVVDVLGKFPLPVEVIPMAREYVARELTALGGRPVYREGCVTDNGNHILDVHDLKITEPKKLEQTINAIAGVVTVGIFGRRGADVLIVGTDNGAKVTEKK